MYSEARRKLLHIVVVAPALWLRVLDPVQATLLAAGALVFNLIVMPRLAAHRVFRPVERADGGDSSPSPAESARAPWRRPIDVGITLYALAVLLTVMALPHRLDLVAGAWAILGFGDGFATLAGRGAGPAARRWPWNPRKSLVGSAALFGAGSLAAIALMLWTRPAIAVPPSTVVIVWSATAAALVAMLVESLDLRVDDNLTVTFSAAATLWLASLVDPVTWSAAAPDVVARLAPALGVNLGVAIAAWRARLVDAGGMAAGAVIGVALWVGAGAPGWFLLGAAFAAAAITSRVGERGKRAHGIAEEREGRRGAGNAIANCGAAAVAAVAAIATPYRDLALLALVTGLVAGASDTVASEIGKAVRGTTFSITRLARVAPGTPGAMSVAGTVAGIGAAGLLAGFGAMVGVVPVATVIVVVIASTAGALCESLFASLFESRGCMTNDLLNFLNTVAAMAIAVAWSR